MLTASLTSTYLWQTGVILRPKGACPQKKDIQGDFLLASLPPPFSPPSASVSVPPRVQPGTAPVETSQEPSHWCLCCGIKQPELVPSRARDKSDLVPTIAGNNRNNYLIIPTASTAPRERVTGVQQCLCCTQCLQHVPLKQKMEVQSTPTLGLVH